MFHCNCGCKFSCTALAVIVSAILGVLAAFLQISGVFTLGTVALLVALGVAVVYLGILPVTASACRAERCCRSLGAVLTGILGTILLAAILLVFGIVATSVISAILVGALVFFFALTLTATACSVLCLADCNE
jgi:hypothetical protein